MSQPTTKPSGPAIEIRDARVRLGDTDVLRGVTMMVPRGRMVALIGPNGSGKTTLLRCLLGLQRLDSGEVRILGEPVGPKVLSRVGYVPQRLQLEPSFTISVREFLSLRRRDTRGWFWQSHRRIDSMLHGTLGELGVESILDRPLAGLSGGQLQRVLIAYSLLAEPELLLLDEPTAGVDTPGDQSFYELISSIHARLGLTVVLVSHDLAMVFRQATWVYALNGVICCEGHPEEVLNADSLKAAYGIHVTPYHHHHHGPQSGPVEQPIAFKRR
jgi:ABC-type Mn2+/Zn2+ transport system ATPase subunit